jgi:hypothetical protein
MSSANLNGKICVVLVDRGPVATAVFRVKNGTPTFIRIWTGGKRPSWLKRSTRDMPTIAIDAALPTLAGNAQDMNDARARLTKIGVSGNSLLDLTGDCAVAVRSEQVIDICRDLLDEGLVADRVTSLAALELATFIEETPSTDAAKVTFYGENAILAQRENSKVSVRRFAMPAGATELASTLNLFSGAQIVASGQAEDNAFVVNGRSGTTIRDLRTADREAVVKDLLLRAAKLQTDGKLALFAPPHIGARNAAIRWLPPFAAAFAILSIAFMAPLVCALMKERAKEDACAREHTRFAEIAARAESNRETLARIEKLSLERNKLIDGMTRTHRTIGAVIKIQEAKNAVRGLKLDSISISRSGNAITLSGSLPPDAKGGLDRFADKLGKSRYRQSSDASIREGNGRLNFSVNMEAAQ